MFRDIFNDGKGFSHDRTVVDREVTHFADHFLRDKTYEQLRLIEAIPQLEVTHQLLQACGLVDLRAQDETSVIYIKLIKGNRQSLERMSGNGAESTRRYAKRLSAHLDSPTPAHLLDLPQKYITKDKLSPNFYHIGRFTRGVRVRRAGERLYHYDEQTGSRPWASAVHYSGEDVNDIEYWPLVDHSRLNKDEWYRRMVREPQTGRLSLMSELG
jgi:hypothetical protein